MVNTRTPLIAGNWKMNGSLSANASLLQAVLDGSKGMNCQAAGACFGNGCGVGNG